MKNFTVCPFSEFGGKKACDHPSQLPGQTDASTATQFVSEDQRRGQSGDSDDSGDTSEDDEYDTDLDVSEESEQQYDVPI